MSGIVCAIRGGPHSRSTIDDAIAVARETKLLLYFLYVVNLDFLTHSTTTRTHTINKEMEQMGEFILLAAQRRAADEHVDAQTRIRHGSVGEEIIALCRELQADYLVLGRPQFDEDAPNIFSHERLRHFAELVREQSGAEVIIAGQQSP